MIAGLLLSNVHYNFAYIVDFYIPGLVICRHVGHNSYFYPKYVYKIPLQDIICTVLKNGDVHFVSPHLLPSQHPQQEGSQLTVLCPDIHCILPHTSPTSTIYGPTDTPMHTLQPPPIQIHTSVVRISRPTCLLNKKVLNIPIPAPRHPTSRLTLLHRRPFTVHPLPQCTRCRHHEQEHTRQSLRFSRPSTSRAERTLHNTHAPPP